MTDKNEAIERAWANFRAARKRLDGASGKSASGVEAQYGEAYQALVRLGAQPQLKGKYR